MSTTNNAAVPIGERRRPEHPLRRLIAIGNLLATRAASDDALARAWDRELEELQKEGLCKCNTR